MYFTKIKICYTARRLHKTIKLVYITQHNQNRFLRAITNVFRYVTNEVDKGNLYTKLVFFSFFNCIYLSEIIIFFKKLKLHFMTLIEHKVSVSEAHKKYSVTSTASKPFLTIQLTTPRHVGSQSLAGRHDKRSPKDTIERTVPFCLYPQDNILTSKGEVIREFVINHESMQKMLT